MFRPRLLKRIISSIFLFFFCIGVLTTPFSTGASAAAIKIPTGLAQIIKITSGSYFTCVLTSLGEVMCWGSSPNFERSEYAPVQVPNLPEGIVDIAAGFDHICALMQTGGVKCWGYNISGQLGNGETNPHTATYLPVDVINLPGKAVSIAASSGNTCALMENGALECWGANSVGQLANTTGQDSSIPVEIQGLPGAIHSFSLGGTICAINEEGVLYCWGLNMNGSAGNPNKINQTTPWPVPGLNEKVVQVSTGGYATCAVLLSGKVMCWGNLFANISTTISENTEQLTPTEVTGLPEDIGSVSVHGNHACALTLSGDVYCWGYNRHGELGNGTLTDQLIPDRVKDIPAKAAAVVTGMEHTCALTETSQVFCWGRNWSGQIGNGAPIEQHAPVRIAEPVHQINYNEIDTWASSSCGLTQDGVVKCWGYDVMRNLGEGLKEDYSQPTGVRNLPPKMHGIAVNVYSGCAINEAGGVICWGSGQLKSDPVAMPTLSQGVTGLAAGSYHTCALLDSGAVRCWGDNQWGQLGIGSTSYQSGVKEVSSLPSRAIAIASGEAYTCALLDIGQVYCWGRNMSGELGNGTTQNSSIPVQVLADFAGLDQITAGYNFVCAWNHAGRNLCWGAAWHGEMGKFVSSGMQSIPASIEGLSGGLRALAIGGGHICAVLDPDGSLYCWGYNIHGQLGDPAITDLMLATPHPVSGLDKDVLSVSAAYYHTCAIKKDGSAYCWGANTNGQVGDGAVIYSALPSEVVGLDNLQTLILRHQEGKPGSVFTAIGIHYPASTTFSIRINNKELAKTSSNWVGYFSVAIDTARADHGYYQISVVPMSAGGDPVKDRFSSKTPTLSTQKMLFIDDNNPLINQEGGGTLVTIPEGIARSSNENWQIFIPAVSH